MESHLTDNKNHWYKMLVFASWEKFDLAITLMKFLNFDMKSKSVVIYINANYVYFQTLFKTTTIISLHPLILTSTMHKMVLPRAFCAVL